MISDMRPNRFYNIGKKFANFQDKWSSEENYLEWCYQWLDLCINKLKKKCVNVYNVKHSSSAIFRLIFAKKNNSFIQNCMVL